MDRVGPAFFKGLRDAPPGIFRPKLVDIDEGSRCVRRPDDLRQAVQQKSIARHRFHQRLFRADALFGNFFDPRNLLSRQRIARLPLHELALPGVPHCLRQFFASERRKRQIILRAAPQASRFQCRVSLFAQDDCHRLPGGSKELLQGIDFAGRFQREQEQIGLSASEHFRCFSSRDDLTELERNLPPTGEFRLKKFPIHRGISHRKHAQ